MPVHLLPENFQKMMFDKHVGKLINNHIRVPVTDRVVSNISPIHNGNVYISFFPLGIIKDRESISTMEDSFDFSFQRAKAIIPALNEKDVITSWIGITAQKHGKTIIENVEPAKNNPRFINLTPKMPAIDPSPLVAKDLVALMEKEGLPLNKKPNFNPKRNPIPRFALLSDQDKDRLIAEDPGYGNVICRCEKVTEGEIVETVIRGANTVQGVQFRPRAGMGRCQSGFCGPKLVRILSKELGIPTTDVTKKGGESRILLYNSKELLQVA